MPSLIMRQKHVKHCYLVHAFEQIQKIAQRIMVDAVMVQVAATHNHSSIEQCFYQVDATVAVSMRYSASCFIIDIVSCRICNTKRETQEIAAG